MLRSFSRPRMLLECNKARTPEKKLVAGTQEQRKQEAQPQAVGISGSLGSFVSLRYYSDFGLRVRSAHFHSIAIGPAVLHCRQDETGKNHHEQHKPALLGP